MDTKTAHDDAGRDIPRSVRVPAYALQLVMT